MDTVKVKIIAEDGVQLPAYETSGAAGMDLRAHLSCPVSIPPMGRALIPTGLRIALPAGYEAQVRPRSGLAYKKGITVLNSPGTIDCDYRGEIGVILCNLGSEIFVVNNNDRIAQMIVAPYSRVEFEKEIKLDNTVRGEGGFGHTGV